MADTPALDVGDDDGLRRIRQEHTEASTPGLCLSFAGASVEVKMTSASFLASTHYPGTLVLANTSLTVGWINSVPYHMKDRPLETRACLEEPYEWWLPSKYGLDARTRTLELHYFVEGATESSATVLCRPSAAYAGGQPGLRLRALAEPSFSATLVRYELCRPFFPKSARRLTHTTIATLPPPRTAL